MPQALAYRCTADGMVPLVRHRRRYDAEFVSGSVYRLKVDEERSPESHRHYFACVARAFENLPEAMSDIFASPEHLRHWCLIKAGYRTERTWIAPTPEDAIGIANFIAPMDEFAVIMQHGNLVTVWTAKTQKLRRNSDDGMDKQEFEASKEAVLRICAELIGTDVATLTAQEAPPIAPADAERETEAVQ